MSAHLRMQSDFGQSHTTNSIHPMRPNPNIAVFYLVFWESQLIICLGKTFSIVFGWNTAQIFKTNHKASDFSCFSFCFCLHWVKKEPGEWRLKVCDVTTERGGMIPHLMPCRFMQQPILSYFCRWVILPNGCFKLAILKGIKITLFEQTF